MSRSSRGWLKSVSLFSSFTCGYSSRTFNLDFSLTASVRIMRRMLLVNLTKSSLSTLAFSGLYTTTVEKSNRPSSCMTMLANRKSTPPNLPLVTLTSSPRESNDNEKSLPSLSRLRAHQNSSLALISVSLLIAASLTGGKLIFSSHSRLEAI